MCSMLSLVPSFTPLLMSWLEHVCQHCRKLLPLRSWFCCLCCVRRVSQVNPFMPSAAWPLSLYHFDKQRLCVRASKTSMLFRPHCTSGNSSYCCRGELHV